MKPVCIIERDALDPEDVKKLEDDGYLVVKATMGRRCEIMFPPEWSNGVH